ncbi:MAG: sugar ABC transporter substrate-binding protein [Butyricicoccus sp.]
MKKILSAVLAGAMALSLTACGGSSSSADSGNASGGTADGEMSVGFVVKALNDTFWMQMKAGAEDKAKELGVHVEFVGPNSESDVQMQVDMIENMIGMGVDALCVAPSSQDTVLSAFELASKSGIPILAIDTDINYDKKLSFIGTGNVAAAENGGRYVVEQLGENKKAVILRGRLGDASQDEREQGYKTALEAGGWEVLEVQAADSDAEKAMNITQDIMQRHDQIDAILATNDPMAQGAQRAIEAAGRDIAVLGFNGSNPAVELVLEGKLLGTVAQSPYNMGAMGVENAIKAAKGEKIESRIDTGSDVITAENGEDYLKMIASYS